MSTLRLHGLYDVSLAFGIIPWWKVYTSLTRPLQSHNSTTQQQTERVSSNHHTPLPKESSQTNIKPGISESPRTPQQESDAGMAFLATLYFKLHILQYTYYTHYTPLQITYQKCKAAKDEGRLVKGTPGKAIAWGRGEGGRDNGWGRGERQEGKRGPGVVPSSFDTS